jgi:hypothetical protein
MLLCQEHLAESRKDNTSPCVYCQNMQYRKLLWVIARNYEGLQLYVSNKDLALIPADAELLQWNEPLFDSVILKAICSSINQPDLAKKVHDSSEKKDA